MELWIPITIAAAFIQNIRFMLQKSLKGALSTFGVTYARFVFAVPLALVLVVWLVAGTGRELPGMGGVFYFYALIGGVAQILATACLVALFSLRNFAVGVSFSKTETVQTAIFGLIILGDRLSGWGLAAIVISLVGVILLSVEPGKLVSGGLSGRAVALGLGSGALFGVAAVSYRAASLSLGGGDFLIRAALTLAVVTVMQTAIMTVWLVLREPGEVGRVLGLWRRTGWVGLTGMLGSLGWFAAMTLQNAAYVRALGQIELVFTFLASWLFFREAITRREVLGIALLMLGIVVLLLRQR